MAFRPQGLFEGAQAQQDVVALRGLPHESHAPGLALQRAEAAAEFESVCLEQPPPDAGFVDALRGQDGVDGRSAVGRVDEEREAHGVDPGPERLVVQRVPPVAVLQALLVDEDEGFPQRVEQAHGRGVVIDPVAVPVRVDQGEVQVPAVDRRLARVYDLQRAVIEREGRQARRGAQAFLAAGIADVDPPFVDFDGRSAQGRHGVDQDEGAVLVDDGDDLLEGLQHARRRFRVYQAHELRPAAGKGLSHLSRRKGPARFAFEPDQLAPVALDHLGHAVAEHAAHADEDLVSRFDEIADTGLHAGGTRGGDRQGQVVPGLEHVAEQRLGIVHDPDEIGVQVPRQRSAHGLVDPRMHVARAGSHEDAPAGIEGGVSIMTRGHMEVFPSELS